MSSVVLKEINKSYVDCRALDNVSLSIEDGEFMTLLGASGSGKTTLLNVIAGMVEPDTGSVLISDTDMTWIESRKRGLGMVFQSYALVPHMTVEENIAFPLKIRRLSRSEIRQRVSGILKIVQLEHLAKRKPRELSGGQQQRVAIARCLVYEPPVILMDEPLGALDKKLRDQLQREIRRIHQETRVTIIYVTHDQEEALFLSDRICLMRGGRIEQLGTPEDLYFRPRNVFVADFLGESNLLDCKVESAKTVRLPGGQVLRATLPEHDDAEIGDDRQLMIRPDRLRFVENDDSALNTLEGIVDATAFVGEVTRYTVRIGQVSVIVKARPIPGACPRSAGSTVRVAWAPEDALILQPGSTD
ncbi:ABC transporter ATP-binding protein [Pollutimonas bauzanensis]|uniref:Putative spermidine/putrescine transport system ATP-binding protein n=1 Tax=Pollutimonas bauzanensis TaxID=658167 RepID=A0A1M5XU98_9BURK|nr:ABC transporter ATP-binding protein [Pollutimonas bauzanensis]SHI03108.1 putative spermidine/putrescine transport system ATP-binding protein [Pollutimonas bauzanensis]